MRRLLASVALAMVFVPPALVVLVLVGLKWIGDRIELWAVYGGDAAKRDKDIWRHS